MSKKRLSLKRRLAKQLSRRTLYPFLNKHLDLIAPGSRVAQIGSGGVVTEVVKEKAARIGFHVTTLDYNPDKKPDIVCDITKPMLDAGSFDVIFICEVLEHVRSPFAAVEGLKHLLRPSGSLILTTPFIFPLHARPHDYFRYTKYGLQMLFEEWTECEVTEKSGWAETGCLLIGRLAFEKEAKVRFIGVPLLVIMWLISPLARLIDRLFSTDFVSSGYLMTCKSPGPKKTVGTNPVRRAFSCLLPLPFFEQLSQYPMIINSAGFGQ